MRSKIRQKDVLVGKRTKTEMYGDSDLKGQTLTLFCAENVLDFSHFISHSFVSTEETTAHEKTISVGHLCRRQRGFAHFHKTGQRSLP